MPRPTFKFKGFTIRAAGIIPYFTDDDNLVTHFLMINKDGVYEDFGGKTDSTDGTVYETAVREAEEESNGVLKRSELASNIFGANTYISQNSKYVVFFVPVQCMYNPEIFGKREEHDGIDRTVEWLTSDELLSRDLHPRLKYRKFRMKVQIVV